MPVCVGLGRGVEEELSGGDVEGKLGGVVGVDMGVKVE